MSELGISAFRTLGAPEGLPMVNLAPSIAPERPQVAKRVPQRRRRSVKMLDTGAIIRWNERAAEKRRNEGPRDARSMAGCPSMDEFGLSLERGVNRQTAALLDCE